MLSRNGIVSRTWWTVEKLSFGSYDVFIRSDKVITLCKAVFLM